MKNKIIGLLVLGLVLIPAISFASATVALKWAEYKKLNDGSYQELQSWAFTTKNIQVFKFKDDETVCYVLYPIVPNGNIYSPSMQCSIK